MNREDNEAGAAVRSSRKIPWITGAVLIFILLLAAFQGMLRGGGEAVSIHDAAPGDNNARPAPSAGAGA